MAVGFSRVSCLIAAFLCRGDALRRKSDKEGQESSDERSALLKGVDYGGRSSRETQAYLKDTTGSAREWRYGPNWKDSFVGALKGLGRTGVEVDDHDGTPIGNGESIGLVAATLTLDKSQINKLPPQFQTGLFSLCGSSTCPKMKAAIRMSHTNAASLDLMRISLKVNTKIGEVDFTTTETLKGFPIANRDQLNAFAFQVRRGLPAALLRFPREFAQLAGQTNNLVKAFGDETTVAGALGKDYYSMIPFRLGNAGSSAGAFKMRLAAQQPVRFPGAGSSKAQYLKNMRDQFVENVEADEHRFSFDIQVATDPKHHSVMDAATVWNETSAPWIRMGDVVIPRQRFSKPVTVGNVVGSGLWVNGRASFNSKELRFNPSSAAHPPIGDIGHFRTYLYPIYDKERQEYLLGKSGGAPAVCPWAMM